MVKYRIVPKEHTRLAVYDIEADIATVETVFVYFYKKLLDNNTYDKKFIHAISIEDVTSFTRIEAERISTQ